MLEKLKIAGFDVVVRISDKLIPDRGNWGEYCPRDKTISIDKSITGVQQLKETFLHETLEAINEIYGVDLEHDDLKLLSKALHQVMVDNDLSFIRGS